MSLRRFNTLENFFDERIKSLLRKIFVRSENDGRRVVLAVRKMIIVLDCD